MTGRDVRLIPAFSLASLTPSKTREPVPAKSRQNSTVPSSTRHSSHECGSWLCDTEHLRCLHVRFSTAISRCGDRMRERDRRTSQEHNVMHVPPTSSSSGTVGKLRRRSTPLEHTSSFPHTPRTMNLKDAVSTCIFRPKSVQAPTGLLLTERMQRVYVPKISSSGIVHITLGPTLRTFVCEQ